MIKAPASTDVTITVYAHDKLTDAGKTGLVAASLNAYFSRVETDNDVTATAITESNLTALTDAHSDGGWYPIDATNMQGHYRFDLPDAVCAAGAVEAVVSIQDAGDNNFIIMPTKIELQVNEKIADAVWDEAATGHTDAGKAGEQLWTDIDAILVDTADIQSRIPAALENGRIKSKVEQIHTHVLTDSGTGGHEVGGS